MSWSSPSRVLGVCGLWLAIQTGCGGNPEVTNPDSPNFGGTSGGGADGISGSSGSLNIGMAGDDQNGEGGNSEPATYVCGNGELEPGEFCDDGGTDDDDGCAADCSAVDPEYDCSDVGKACVKVVVCGDGVLQGDEQCDDGNEEDDDGCAADCKTVEDGFVCIRPGQPCRTKPECGNGKRDPGEACDDGIKGNAGCNDDCQIDDGYYCVKVGEECKPAACGNGDRTLGEACDDGNTKSGDGCSKDCKTVEPGWHCNSTGCQAQCGDGVVVGAEKCDDKNAISGDGCSAACTIEPFFSCSGTPSKCVSTIACNNGKVEPGEVCDPKANAKCNATCNGYIVTPKTPVCGDQELDKGEECLPGTAGCVNCVHAPGWTCLQPTKCIKLPTCGDGIVNAGEACDDGDKVGGDGCDATCKVETGYTCVGLGPSVCSKPVCGNSMVDAGEQCDDGAFGAGCVNCKLETGWACPAPGAACIPKCGDGVKVTGEECDDANKVSGDGCNAGCNIEPGFKCPTVGQKCVASVCGDKNQDVGEGCDDGNLVAGDGCGPTCQPEPTVDVGPNPKVNVFCGDGLKIDTEECDDGNVKDGDGCEHDCKITKPGWTCSGKLTLPTSLKMKVTYRDFKSAPAAGGHPDFMYDDLGHVAGITGGVCTSATANSADKTKCGHLDVDGKPELIVNDQNNTGIRDAASFKMWYRDGNPDNTNGFNGKITTSTITSTLTLNQTGGATSEVYVFDAGGNNFYPIDGQGQGNMNTEGIGCGNHGYKNQHDSVAPNTGACFCQGDTDPCGAKNYGFTTELRYFFQYKGGERLTFSGDDDVWVYVNGRVAVDIGGLHPQKNGQVVLGDDGNGNAAQDSNCSAHSTDAAPPDPGTDAAPLCLTTAERTNNTDDRFGLTKGGVYEIVLFHAERHVAASNFKLTLAGFLAPRSSCDTICGDGVVAGDEFCDNGVNNSDTASGACNTACTARAYCGDGVRQLPGEACDNGTNLDLYKTAQSAPSVCAPGCKVPASCGDGVPQAGQGEQCDKGAANNDSAYGPDECKTNCKLGGYCGDGTKQGPETCDLGAKNGQTYGAGSCGYDCKAGMRCGDGIINDMSELCDDGAMNGSITSHCSVTCKIVPYCGDGTKSATEACDWGPFATDKPTEYGGCSSMCTLGPSCGDGTKNGPEECDQGAKNNNATYNGCTLTCTLGPRCGDGVQQADKGEKCDNGFNADEYADPKSPQGQCGMNCQLPPFCGDGATQENYEYCDNGDANNDTEYGGCTTKCEYGPACGDGEINGPELCDEGLDNVGYSPDKGACGYDCQFAPYCGDGERNGPEQCDLGAKKNTGDYGTCNPDCTFALRCGDKNVDKGEECDDGPTGSLSCTPGCKRRIVVQ